MNDVILNLFSQISSTELALIFFSIAGQELITKRNKNGFLFWMAANLCGIFLFYADGRGLMLLLYAYYFIKCVQGLLHWKKMDEVKRDHLAEISTLKSRIAELEHPVDTVILEIDPSIESSNVLRKMVSDLAYVQLLSSANKFNEIMPNKNDVNVKEKLPELSNLNRIAQC